MLMASVLCAACASERSIRRAAVVRDCKKPELVTAVTQGDIEVSKAASISAESAPFVRAPR
jgi:hypothetical protein